MTATAASTTYVQNLYSTILLRSPGSTDTGVQTWASLLDSGLLTQSQEVAAFENSPEAQNDVFPIVRMYETFFNRAPDSAGLTGWVNALRNGTLTEQQIAQGFIGSAEFQGIYGSSNPDPTAFVTALYQHVLGRAPDAAGLAGWVNALANGQLTAAQVALGFSDSAEYIKDSNAGIDNWFTAANANAQAGTTPIYPSTITITPQSTSVVLTTGVDNLTPTGNTAITGTINGSAANPQTFNAFDTIAGTGTANSLNLVDLNGTGTATLPAATVSGIQTLTIQGTGTDNVVANTTGFTGLTALNITSSAGADAITAGSGTAITVLDALTTGNMTVDGGSSAVITATAVGNTDAITVGGTTPVAGNVTVTSTVAASTPGAITVDGGTAAGTITVTQNASTFAGGAIKVNIGPASATTAGGTTAVTVNQTITAGKGTYGVVTVKDLNSGAASADKALTTVSVNGYADTSSVTADALANLTLANSAAAAGFTITSAGKAETLNLTLNGVSGTVTDQNNSYSTVNITTTGAASSLTLADTADIGVLAVSGTQALTLAGGTGVTGASGFTVAGGAGVTVTLGATQSFASTSTGTDVVTITAAATKTVTGNGTAAEEIVWNSNTAPTGPTYLGTVSGFKVLGVNIGATETFDFSKITGFSSIDVQNVAATFTATFTNVAAGTSIGFSSGSAGNVVYQTADSTGPTDSVTVNLGTAIATAGISETGSLTLEDSTFNGIGSVSLNALGNTKAGQFTHTLAGLNDSALSSLTIGGAAELTVTALNTSAAALTITNNGTTSPTALGAPTADTITTLTDAALTTLNLAGTGNLTITNNIAATANGITVSGASDNANVTIGLAGVTTSGKTDTITLGNGNNTVTDLTATGGGTANITLGTGTNSVTTGTGTANVTVGTHSAADAFTVGHNASLTSLTTITGAQTTTGDTVTIGGTTAFLATAVAAGDVTFAGGDPTTLAGWVAGAVAGISNTGGTHGLLANEAGWFTFQGNTYVVYQSAVQGTAFGAGDTLIKLTGVMDLSHGAFTGGHIVL
jgi:hypothetical protein